MKRVSVVVVGGGIAGFSVANSLAERGLPVTLLEREALPFTHSSGRNAAIFRPLEKSPHITQLASASLARLSDLSPGLVRHQGLLLVARTAEALAELTSTASQLAVEYTRLLGEDVGERAPALKSGSAKAGLFLPRGGILDIHGLCETMRSRALGRGVRVLHGVEVKGIEASKGRVTGVTTLNHGSVAAEEIVLAAGAWAAALGATCGCPVVLQPHRRHLVHLAQDQLLVRPDAPVCWDVERDCYFRPESGGVLASPGDHTPHAAGLPTVDEAQVVALAQELGRLAPPIANAGVRRAWACLRTMSADGHMLLGADPRMTGLFWFAGLAGHGMTTGLAAAELLAAHMVVGAPLPPALDVRRTLDCSPL